MANKLYEESAVSDIADAIREKNGTQTQYTLAEMGDAVRAIPAGGAELVTLTASANGTYTAPSDKAYGTVTVAVPYYDGW